MAVGAKTLVLTALDLMLDPKLMEQVRAAFDRRRNGITYRSRIPEGRKAPLQYRDR